MWHTLKYTTGLNEKLVYISEPIPEVHDHNVPPLDYTCQSDSETEQDPLNTTIRNSPINIKDPLAPSTLDTQTPFFSIAKSDLSQSITGTTMTTTQTMTQTATTSVVAPQHPLTKTELDKLLNIAMGERGGGTGGTPPGPPGGGGLPGGGGPAATGGTTNQPVATATNVKAMGKDPPTFHGDRSKADTFMNEVEKYLTLNDDVAGFKSPKKKVILVLTFMQGPEVEEWTRGMLQWIQQIPDESNTELIWHIFQRRFYRRFTDTQADSTARKSLTQLKMRFPDIDSYIADFEQTVRKALYRLGSHEMNQQFLSGLP